MELSGDRLRVHKRPRGGWCEGGHERALRFGLRPDSMGAYGGVAAIILPKPAEEETPSDDRA